MTQLDLPLPAMPGRCGAVRPGAPSGSTWGVVSAWLDRQPPDAGRARVIVLTPGRWVAAIVRVPTVAAAAVRVEPLLAVLPTGWRVVVRRRWARPWRAWVATDDGTRLDEPACHIGALGWHRRETSARP